MPKLAPMTLDAAQIQELAHAAAHGHHARERRRAQAVLRQHRGLSRQQVAATYAVSRDTGRRWLPRFAQGGVAALAEGARSGRPTKLEATAPKK